MQTGSAANKFLKYKKNANHSSAFSGIGSAGVSSMHTYHAAITSPILHQKRVGVVSTTNHNKVSPFQKRQIIKGNSQDHHGGSPHRRTPKLVEPGDRYELITGKIAHLNLQLAQFKEDLELKRDDPLLKSTGRLSISAYSQHR